MTAGRIVANVDITATTVKKAYTLCKEQVRHEGVIVKNIQALVDWINIVTKEYFTTDKTYVLAAFNTNVYGQVKYIKQNWV